MILPWRRPGGGAGGPAEVKGDPHGLFVVYDVFVIAGRPVLVGRVLEGYVGAGDLLKAPDGRLLRVDSVEVGRRRVQAATAGQAAGLMVSGVGWKPGRRDLEAYKASRAAGGAGAAGLREALESRALKAYKPG